MVGTNIEQECRIIGNVDGKDNIITGDCCPDDCASDSSCGCDGSIDGIEANPNHDQYFNTSCNGQPSGDVRIFDSILANHQLYGCGDAEGYSPDNCPIFHWLDINGDGEINPWDVLCVDSYYLLVHLQKLIHFALFQILPIAPVKESLLGKNVVFQSSNSYLQLTPYEKTPTYSITYCC